MPMETRSLSLEDLIVDEPTELIEPTVTQELTELVRQNAVATNRAPRRAWRGLDAGSVWYDEAAIYQRIFHDYGFHIPNGHVPGPTTPVDAPSRETLKREPLTVADGPEDELRRLALDAEALLGYVPLRKAVNAPGRLRSALAKLEIEPLEQASVDAYKKQMVDHFRTHDKMKDPTWRLTPIEQYTQPIPEFVLRKACAIKRELPDARFWIDQLAVDPFLIVSVKEDLHDTWTNVSSRGLEHDTQAYVEVWDEPKFEAAL